MAKYEKTKREKTPLKLEIPDTLKVKIELKKEANNKAVVQAVEAALRTAAKALAQSERHPSPRTKKKRAIWGEMQRT